MAHLKQYIDANVYEEAKKRINHIYDCFDTVAVSFSGGKDSLVVLYLNEEVKKERGIETKTTVIFRDEELIPQTVIDFVTNYYKSGDYDFRYYAIPLDSAKFILGKTYKYIQWDNNREWIRPKPEFALTCNDTSKVFDQYTTDAYCTEGLKGKIALLTGIRADESLVRFRSSVNKRNENYINATAAANVKLCKPIFDWSQNDVFKYLYDNKIKYCDIYDAEMWNGDSLRVSTPLHAESAKKLFRLKTLDPVLYQQIVDIFPEVVVQEIYWNSYDQYAVIQKYEKSWNGIVKYIKDHIKDPDEQRKALKMVINCKTYKEKKFEVNPNAPNLGGYPLLYVFKSVIAGNYKRVLMPLSKVSLDEEEYEKGAKV